MKQITIRTAIFLSLAVVAALIQGCGGGVVFRSDVQGTVSDIDRNVIIGAEVWIDDLRTNSLASGAFRLQNVPSGWQTIYARADVDGDVWVGSTAVEVLEGEPTMNANIVLSPAGDTTYIQGYVYDDTGRPVRGARVLLTTRVLLPSGSSSDDGAYNSMVAVTNDRGFYRMDDAPVGRTAVIAASKVAFYNDEVSLDPIHDAMNVDFELSPSFQETPDEPILDYVESYTMPNQQVRAFSSTTASFGNPYDAVRAHTSAKFRRSLQSRKTTTTSAPVVRSLAIDGSLIEIDLYWNALDVNLSRTLAGYGIYRRVGSGTIRAIDFLRDPYANFYGDMGAEIEPGIRYDYRVTAVNVEFLDRWNEWIDESESDWSNSLGVTPLGAMRASLPIDGAGVSATPTFSWQVLSRADSYSVYVYDRFPTIPISPGETTPSYGTAPIWDSPWANTTSVTYAGPALQTGRTYYWLVTASDASGTAYSYSELRSFTR